MAGEEDAMNVIDKLNQEFDVIMDKNIQLEKEKLELYKELHKLKFNLGIARGGLDTSFIAPPPPFRLDAMVFRM